MPGNGVGAYILGMVQEAPLNAGFLEVVLKTPP